MNVVSVVEGVIRGSREELQDEGPYAVGRESPESHVSVGAISGAILSPSLSLKGPDTDATGAFCFVAARQWVVL